MFHILAVLTACIAVATSADLHVALSSTKFKVMQKTNMNTAFIRNDLINEGPAAPDMMHTIVFGVKQNNMEEMTRILHDVSNPSSENYGHYCADCYLE